MGSFGGGGGGGGMNMGQMITGVVSSMANIGAGHYANRKLGEGTDEALGQQDQANALYQSLYGQTEKGFGKFTEGGDKAWDALLASYGIGQDAPDYSGFENSPDYLFAVQQGEKALARRQSAQGNRLSPGAFKELLALNQGLSTQNLGTYRSGLAGMAQMGLSANNSLANYRLGYGNQLGQGYMNKGDLMYARRIGQANINYRNVAAQDSIWGGIFGGAATTGNQGRGTSSYGDNGLANWAPASGSAGSGSYTGPGSGGYSIADGWNPQFGGGY